MFKKYFIVMLLEMYKYTRMYTTWGKQPVFCNNCKWSESFKNYIKMYKYNTNYILLAIKYKTKINLQIK